MNKRHSWMLKGKWFYAPAPEAEKHLLLAKNYENILKHGLMFIEVLLFCLLQM